MKKLLLLSLVAFTFLSASAQNKIGFISQEDLINSMPEADKVNAALQDYQASLVQQGQDYNSELQEKDSIFIRDSAKLSPAAKELRRNDLIALYQKVQGWQQTMQQMINDKEQALLVPIRQKAMQAIRDVAKENGYAYVFEQQAVIISPQGDDLLPLVKKKLGIKDVPKAPAGGAPMQQPQQ
jgi:outer membrane protein